MISAVQAIPAATATPEAATVLPAATVPLDEVPAMVPVPVRPMAVCIFLFAVLVVFSINLDADSLLTHK